MFTDEQRIKQSFCRVKLDMDRLNIELTQFATQLTNQSIETSHLKQNMQDWVLHIIRNQEEMNKKLNELNERLHQVEQIQCLKE